MKKYDEVPDFCISLLLLLTVHVDVLDVFHCAGTLCNIPLDTLLKICINKLLNVGQLEIWPHLTFAVDLGSKKQHFGGLLL